MTEEIGMAKTFDEVTIEKLRRSDFQYAVYEMVAPEDYRLLSLHKTEAAALRQYDWQDPRNRYKAGSHLDGRPHSHTGQTFREYFLRKIAQAVPRSLTHADLDAAGIRVGELAKVLGVHRTTISDMLSSKTGRPTPGAHAVAWAWPRLSGTERDALLAGEHFVEDTSKPLSTLKSE